MSSWFEDGGLPGFTKWLRMQYQEELEHGLKIFDFINNRDGRAWVHGFDAPPAECQSPLDVFQRALAHEQKVTGLINKLYALAVAENDYAAQVLLQWYINEQVEEEKNATNIVEQLKLIGKDGSALLISDRELGARKGTSGMEATGGGDAT